MNESKNFQYGVALMSDKTVQHLNGALTMLTTLISISMILVLDLAWSDIGLGFLVALGLNFLIGIVVGAVMVQIGRVDLIADAPLPLNLVLGSSGLVVGLGLFVGFSAAILVVYTPMLIGVPLTLALRSWAIARLPK